MQPIDRIEINNIAIYLLINEPAFFISYGLLQAIALRNI